MGVRDTITKALMGIKAYHSSPHDFDKFDLKKIGTGEGAQVYGHGLYFAENPNVSGRGGQYWQQFQQRFPDPERMAADRLRVENWDRDKAVDLARKDFEYWKEKIGSGDPHQEYTKRMFDTRQRELELLQSGAPVGPRTYEVNIKADPAQMLDWDKPLRGQPQRSVFPDVAKEFSAKNPSAADMYHFLKNEGDQASSVSGVDFYRSLVDPRSRDAAHVSAALSEAGIPGIKYLDEGSRNLPQGEIMGAQKTPQGWVSSIRSIHPSNFNGGTVITKSMPFPDEAAALQWATEKVGTKPTSNYVVFDPSIVDIMKKYGVAAMPTGALAADQMGSTFDQRYYGAQ